MRRTRHHRPSGPVARPAGAGLLTHENCSATTCHATPLSAAGNRWPTGSKLFREQFIYTPCASETRFGDEKCRY